MKGRIFMISIFFLLALATVMIFGTAMRNDRSQVYTPQQSDQEIMIAREAGVFQRSNSALYNDKTEGQRTMSTYYENRAYPGAPPSISHPVLSEDGIGGKGCLQCHQKGGYVEQFKAFAPVTPHADWLNCKQCHVPSMTNTVFQNTNWVKPKPPTLGNKALFTGPQVIPHPILGRENCLSCHAGPGAPKEIRVSHPERSNCRQCHVPIASDDFFNHIANSVNGHSFLRADTLYNHTTLDGKKANKLEQWIQQ